MDIKRTPTGLRETTSLAREIYYGDRIRVRNDNWSPGDFNEMVMQPKFFDGQGNQPYPCHFDYMEIVGSVDADLTSVEE